MSTAHEATQTAPDDDTVNSNTPPANQFDGKFVSMTGNHLVMTNLDGRRFSHTLAKDAKVCCDGATCQPIDLKVGNRIRVTTKKDDRNVATGVEALNQQAEFAHCG